MSLRPQALPVATSTALRTRRVGEDLLIESRNGNGHLLWIGFEREEVKSQTRTELGWCLPRCSSPYRPFLRKEPESAS